MITAYVVKEEKQRGVESKSINHKMEREGQMYNFLTFVRVVANSVVRNTPPQNSAP